MSINSSETVQPAELVQPPQAAQKVPEAQTVDFGTPPHREPCSWNECSKGHKFSPIVQVAGCPGCGGPLVIVKMVNCPLCNEPVSKLTLRTEHIPQGGQIQPMCAGGASLNEVDQIVLNRRHAAEEEANHTVRPMISKT